MCVRQARRLIGPLVLAANDTPFTITILPLADTYNSAVLGYADAAPAPTATPRPKPKDTPAPTAAPTPVTPTPTPTPVAPLLPETGSARGDAGPSLAAVLHVLAASVALLGRARR